MESNILKCHCLSLKKRLLELLFFTTLYCAGVLVTVFSGNQAPILILGYFLMGICLNSLGILIHEGIHGLLIESKSVNRLLTFLCGVPLLISGSAYSVTHRDHHFEFGRGLDYGTYRQHLTNNSLIWLAYFSQLFLGSIIYVVLIPVLAFRSASAKERFFILIEYLVISLIIIFAFLSLPKAWIINFWLLPSIVLILMSNVRGLASHALGDPEDIYLSSRTVKCSRLFELLLLHENYHLEHHLFPRVPSYNLKEVHGLIWERLPRALYSDSYYDFLKSFFASACSLDLSPKRIVVPANRLSA